MPAVAIEFHRGPARRYRSILHRADGVGVELDGGAYNAVGGPAREVPHDIAHLIVEDELGLELGVWGVLARGGLFRGAAVVAGRRRPHAARHARATLAAATEQLNQAEVLTRAVCDLAARGEADVGALRSAAGARWWAGVRAPASLESAVRRLQAAGERWAALGPGGTIDATWRPPPRR